MTPAAEAAAALRQEIRSGHYTIGARLSNERLLATRFGVSRGTIRQALRILETERLIARQQGRGTFVANPAHAPVQSAGAALIGALVYEKELYFGSILQSASSQAASRGYVLTTGSNLSEEDESQHIDAFIRSGHRGVIVAPTRVHTDKAHDRLLAAKIPVVFLDTMIRGRDEDFVGVDNHHGTYIAAQHLIALGHRRLAYVGHNDPSDVPCKRDRVAGFEEACKEAGLPIDPSWVIEAGEDQDYSELLHPVFRKADRPTGIVTFSDTWAIRVLAAARAFNLRIPDDLSVIGFDDSSIARNYDVPITSVHPEFLEIGTAAVNMLVEKIENPRPRPKISVMVTPRLVVRQSTAKPCAT